MTRPAYLQGVMQSKAKALPPVSKQLAISSAFSIFAMAAFVLLGLPGETAAGAKAVASAPTILQITADLPFLSN